MKLKDKITLITGGTHGIGEAIARRFVAEGAAVALAYHLARLDRGRRQGGQPCGRARGGGRAGPSVQGGLRQVGPEIDRLVDEVLAAFGGLDILVNNAGTITFAPVEETTEANWDEQLDLTGGTQSQGAVFPGSGCAAHI